MPRRFDFDFDLPYRAAALPLGIAPRTTYVEVGEGPHAELRVRFGPWSLRTPLANVASAQRTGPYSFVKTAGPPHLSFSDRGVSFATNGRAGVCVQFHQPVAGIDPTGRIRHPGATMTVRDVPALLTLLGRPAR